MGFLDCFAYRSAKQRKYDSDHYFNWAFPYGEAQKAKIIEILNELTSEKSQIALSAYLIGKEAAIGDWQSERHKPTFESAITAITKVLQSKNIDSIAIYLALIEADYEVDENLNYPTKDNLCKRAKILTKEIEGL